MPSKSGTKPSSEAAALVVSAAGDVATSVAPAAAAETTSAAASEEGFVPLFDGTSFAGWKNYGAAPGAPVRGWEIQDGTLAMVRDTSMLGLIWNVLPFGDGILDLMTERRFGDVELRLEWKISPGGNSGIFYLVPDESTPLAWDLGLEMQVLDNDGHRDGSIAKHRAGDLYDLQASASEPVRPVGEWNQVRIRIEGPRIRHWLNGELIVDVSREGPAWDAMLAESKFADVEGFGLAREGHIVLQDHGDPVWYRNLRVRELAGAAAEADGSR